MTFRPSDDVLEEMKDNPQSVNFVSTSDEYDYSNASLIENGERQGDFQQPNVPEIQTGNTFAEASEVGSVSIEYPSEEVKAPNLSDLLQQSESQLGEEVWLVDNNVIMDDVQSVADTGTESQSVFQENLPLNKDNGENSQNWIIDESSTTDDEVYEWISDYDRSEIVSKIPGSIHWKLDLLVDERWYLFVVRYKKISHLLFRWWLLFISSVIGVVLWVFSQVESWKFIVEKTFNESLIQNKSLRRENTSDRILLPLIESWVDMEVLVPYGFVSLNKEMLQSKSNLIKYRWFILPQFVYIDYSSDEIISNSDFVDGKVTREDLEVLLKYLVINDSLVSKIKNMENVTDSLWNWYVFEWWSLIDWFNLGCLNNKKVSDYICDKFIWNFYEFWKYYDLSSYAWELYSLVKNLYILGKDVEPVCWMIIDYTLRSWVINSDELSYSMDYCLYEEKDYYKKIVNFIRLENSLWQSEVSNEVFDDPDLNGYKLLSSWQSVYRVLHGWTINEDYIKSYLNFVQSLLIKDKGTNRYLLPLYKDLLYIFNNDELYQVVIKNPKFSSDLKVMIEQINNGNPLYGYPSLISQLTTPNIIKSDIDYSNEEIEESSIEDILSQYYYMNDRLKIRKYEILSDENVKLQVELFDNKILSVTNWESLKCTLNLYRNGNVLYVSNIKIAQQAKLSDILNIYLSNWNVSFYALLTYIDEQVWMWYEDPKLIQEEIWLCDQLREWWEFDIYSCDNSSISLYKWEIEYNFELNDGVLVSFDVSDPEIDSLIKEKFTTVMTSRDNTSALIKMIVDFQKEESLDQSIGKKLDIIDQFRIHFKLVPDDVKTIPWEDDVFLVDFALWEFYFQAHYDLESHMLTNISYVQCNKVLEIRKLTIELTAENDDKLMEIINNPRVFFAQVNPSAYKKYQRLCDDDANK